jgi:hypothetical protein
VDFLFLPKKMMSKPKYYLKVNLPATFDDLDAEVIKKDLITYINSRNQYGALYGPKSSKKGIVVEKIIYSTNED